MADPITLHTSTRIEVTDPTAITWRADADDAPRHAFPERDGFPAPAICGQRWTVRFGRQGNAWCVECLAGLKDQIRAATAALRVVEHDELGAGDFYAGMDR